MDLFLGNPTSEFCIYNPDLRLPIFLQGDVKSTHFLKRRCIALYQFLQLLGGLQREGEAH